MSIRESHSSVSVSDEEDPIEVSVVPTEDGHEIQAVRGRMGNLKVDLDSTELAALPFLIKGASGSLAEKIKFRINGHTNKEGEVEVFLTGLTTTLVQFKLMGRVFPKTSDLKLTTESLNYSTLKRLAKIAKHDHRMQSWLSEILKFWNNYKFMLSVDSSLDLTNSMIDLLRQENKRIKQELLAVKEEQTLLRSEIFSLKEAVKQLKR